MTGIEDIDKVIKESKENAALFDTPEQSRAKTRAMRILGSRQLSSGDIERRLTDKGESAEIARETVAWLEDIGALDDKEYAAAIARHYQSKGYGLAHIKNELYKRGIRREEWDEAISALDEADADEAAFRFLDKKLVGSHDKNDVRRATDALCRRGFRYEDAHSIVSRYLESIENTEET